MPNRIRTCLFAVVTLVVSASAKASPVLCVVNQSSSIPTTFARVDGHAQWHEYRSIKAIPELGTDGDESAQVWTIENGSVLVRTVEPGEDFWRFTQYCFDRRSLLVRLRFEVRTAWGWGYRVEGQVVGSAVKADSVVYFSTRDGRAITRPEQADDIPEALKPTIYPSESRLPFANLLDDSRHQPARGSH